MKKGFTLIEVAVTIAVLGILVLLASSHFVGEAERAKVGHIKNDSRAYENAIEIAKMEDLEFTDFWYEVEYNEIEELKNEGKLYNKRGKLKEEDSLLVERYKIIPKDKEILNTKLKGDFYLDSKGQVYYQHENLQGDRFGNEQSDFYYFYQENPENGEKYVVITGYKGKSKNVVIPEEIDNLPVRELFYGTFFTMPLENGKAPEDPGPNEGGNYTGNYSGVNLRNIHVSSNVRMIRTSAFEGLNLRELVIEEGLETIMEHIISNTKIDKDLVLPKTLKKSNGFILGNSEVKGNLDFGGLTSLKEFSLYNSKVGGTIKIPSTVLELEDHAIAGNVINKIKFEEGLIKVGRFGFYENTSEENGFELILPNSLEQIEEWGFPDNEISNLKLGNKLKTIGQFAFHPSVSIYEEVTIPENVERIGQFAFSLEGSTEKYSSTIKRVILHGGEKIGPHAFDNPNLEYVEIGEKVKEIESFAFVSNSMKEVYIPSTVQYVGVGAFDSENVTIGAKKIYRLFAPMTTLKELTILSSVEEIVENDTVPNNVEKIIFEAPFMGLTENLISREYTDENGNVLNPLYLYGPSEMTSLVESIISSNNLNVVWIEQ